MKCSTLSVALACVAALTFASVASAQVEHADHPVDPTRPVPLAVTGLTVRLPVSGTWQAGTERLESGTRSDTLHYRDGSGGFSAVVRVAIHPATRCEAVMDDASSPGLTRARFAAWGMLYPVMIHSSARVADVFCVDGPRGAVALAVRFVGVDATRLPDPAQLSFETSVVEAVVSARDPVHRARRVARRSHDVSGA